VTLSPPEPIGPEHQCDHFSSGAPSLDERLQRRALSNHLAGASRTYVVCDGVDVVGYHALAASNIAVIESTGRFRRNMPDPVPVIVLARLAIDRNWQGKGLARALFRDAAERARTAGDIIGARGLIVHAISEDARAFYLKLGMLPSPLDPMTLMITFQDLR
jgi:GNAT superfamily N-acetyltransferase